MALGFGGYRISIESDEHRQALEKAIEYGITLIDTSANYTDGASEKLIGEVLKKAAHKPLIISKVGYIQGTNLSVVQELNEKGLAKDDLVKVNDSLWHSIHPEFIRNQIELSLERLGLETLDAYLLHNPEYYFYEEGATQEEYYARIDKAFACLEELVVEGKIREYGISSNNFILSAQDPKVTDIDRIYECATKQGENHHFKWVQFPFNLIEIDALEKHYGPFSLLDKARGMGLKTMINRPLNAFAKGDQGDQLVRLASYGEFMEFDSKERGEQLLNHCLDLIDQKVRAEDPDEDIREVPIIKQFVGLWNTLPSEDAVQQVFMGHFFPLVARIWGGDLSAKESEPFYELYDCALNFSRQRMNQTAEDFRQQAIKTGLIQDDSRPLQVTILEKYQEYGFDYILVGMKRPIYVDQLKDLF
ncbi:aldo/keto reductase [Bacteriovorax sp. DB6_IX]|uniref:aldo/keto reductase n=1 Tax=Bacteriovorax sp. DB6_IX TaxID=1353530 RepID=UPI000389FA46|nr:aldo/keto reductase [Bacteriovorax sp. DB6_IX]EQC51159.1 oxidoreductase, aldo/keto reductase family protein [Bacteriovorax sp. DB6_IX]